MSNSVMAREMDWVATEKFPEVPMTRTARFCWLLLRTTTPEAYTKPMFPAGTKNANSFFAPIPSEAGTSEDKDKAADDLFCSLNEKRRQLWTETVESSDFMGVGASMGVADL